MKTNARMTLEQYAQKQARTIRFADYQKRQHDTNVALTQAVDALVPVVRKYGNVPTRGYASKREAERAQELMILQYGKFIRNLREQVRYLLIPRQGTECGISYIADFVYEEDTGHGWETVVEDAKGVRTPEYIIKRKLMLFVHGIKIREV